MAEPFVQVLVRLTPELHAALKACAEDEDRTKSATIRCAIRAWVDRHNEPEYSRVVPIAQLPSPPPFERMEPRLKKAKP